MLCSLSSVWVYSRCILPLACLVAPVPADSPCASTGVRFVSGAPRGRKLDRARTVRGVVRAVPCRGSALPRLLGLLVGEFFIPPTFFFLSTVDVQFFF